MSKMSKAAARKRLIEARKKFQKVYMMSLVPTMPRYIVSTKDMEAVEKIVDRCLKRIQ